MDKKTVKVIENTFVQLVLEKGGEEDHIFQT